MSDDEPRFRLEVNEELDPAHKRELERVLTHLLDGGAVMYLEDDPTTEEWERVKEFVDEEIRGDADE